MELKMEYYGEKPKKFTKAWWPYFWDYYKWHTIAILFIIICIVVTIVQAVTREKFDSNVTYAGNGFFTPEMSENINSQLEKYTMDLDGNGEKSLLFEQLNISDNEQDAQYAMAIQTKLDLKFQTDETYLFLLDENQLERLMHLDYASDVFENVEKWAKEMPADELLYKKDSSPYAVKLTNSKIIKDNKISGEQMYVLVRKNYKPEKENLEKQFENAKILANVLIAEK